MTGRPRKTSRCGRSTVPHIAEIAAIARSHGFMVSGVADPGATAGDRHFAAQLLGVDGRADMAVLQIKDGAPATTNPSSAMMCATRTSTSIECGTGMWSERSTLAASSSHRH